MNVPQLDQDFYGAVILEAAIGPRQEVILRMELWPPVNGRPATQWRRGEGSMLKLRFGGITNFDEVEKFFGHFSQGENAGNGLHYLRMVETSKPGRLRIDMEFDRTGDRLRIECRNLTIQEQSGLSA